jgi:uncharacterized protein (DUF2252 family)
MKKLTGLPLTPSSRISILEGRRTFKMARSAHAYVRGNTLQFYEWLETVSSNRVPAGPAVWICGDCHVGNLGPVASAKGGVEIEIRDLDQTVIGNPAHDLIRLALSLATAARGSDLPGVTTARVLEEMMGGYEAALRQPSKVPEKARMTAPVQIALRQALKRKWHHLASERIKDVSPVIPLGKCFWPLSGAEKREVKRLFGTEEICTLITRLKNRKNDADVSVLDAAYWVKGCSSLGRLRYAVLIGVGHKEHAEGRFCLMDIKEATAAAAPRALDARMPRDNAKRVVEGAQQLSPFLGERMLATQFLGRSVVVRELLPQDLKLEMDQLTCEDAITAARFLAGVVGKAHARQMQTGDREKWRADLELNRTKNLDAPSWLWSSTVELVATHEVAYLEHCRKYAMSKSVGSSDA